VSHRRARVSPEVLVQMRSTEPDSWLRSRLFEGSEVTAPTR
jgi:hypothetical protein